MNVIKLTRKQERTCHNTQECHETDKEIRDNMSQYTGMSWNWQGNKKEYVTIHRNVMKLTRKQERSHNTQECHQIDKETKENM